MVGIKQAVFTSARTDRGAGYRLVAATPGISPADQRELAVWGPSHDSLLEAGADFASLNFFPLSDGDYCLSRTTTVGWEYSGRGGAKVYTKCLLLPPAVLRQFGNHPLLLARAAMTGGAWRVCDEARSALDSFDLPGPPPNAERASLARLLRQVSPWQVALLVQSAIGVPGTLAVGGPAPAELLIGGLLDCLPAECRPAISFSTGLRHSARRPFRILALPGDPITRRQLTRQPNVAVLDLAAEPPRQPPANPWAGFIERALAEARIDLLAEALSQPRPGLTLDNLSTLGRQMVAALDLQPAACR